MDLSEHEVLSYGVLSVVILTGVVASVFLLTTPAETAQVVKPYDKVYINPARSEQLMRGDIPSQMTGCGEGYEVPVMPDQSNIDLTKCVWRKDLNVHCCPIAAFSAKY